MPCTDAVGGAYEGGVTSSPYVAVTPVEVRAVDPGNDGVVVMVHGKASSGDMCNGCVVTTRPKYSVVIDKAVTPFSNVGGHVR